jgi:hypothetical protein
MTTPLIRVEEEMVNVRKEAAAMAAGILDIDDEKLRSPSGFLLMEGMASALEKVFTGLERCLTFIARDIDKVPNIKSENWHAVLLIHMSRPNGDMRPAVLSRDLFDRLNVLRAFRDRERNIYGFYLNAERVKEIAASVPETLDIFDAAIAALSAELVWREEQKRLEQERQDREAANDQNGQAPPKPT